MTFAKLPLSRIARWMLIVLPPLLCCNPAAADESAKPTAAKQAARKYTTELVRGRVVWMADALQRRFGIHSVPEAAQRQLALETSTRKLHPLVEDIRGRSFRGDKRLRDIDLQLMVRRYEGSPMLQVIRIFAVKKDGKYELDYWCEICAIGMFELKPCDCCQGPILLRQRKVDGVNKTR